jgi:hypothetical protein
MFEIPILDNKWMTNNTGKYISEKVIYQLKEFSFKIHGIWLKPQQTSKEV